MLFGVGFCRLGVVVVGIALWIWGEFFICCGCCWLVVYCGVGVWVVGGFLGLVGLFCGWVLFGFGWGFGLVLGLGCLCVGVWLNCVVVGLDWLYCMV